MYKIVIKNTVTNQEYVYDNIEDINGGKKLYYNFNIDTSNLDDGEYKLTLFKGDDIVCTELLKVGDFNSEKIQYSKGANVFIDAKPEIELSEISITENGEYNALSNNAWNKINVNISPKIDVATTGIKFGHSTFAEIPDLYNFESVTDMQGMFYSCKNITTISPIDTSNVTNMSSMFYSCSSLTTIPMLNCSNVTNMSYFFGFLNINTLTYLGGFKDLKISVTSNFLDKAPNLTVDSLMNVINNLYDLTANGLSGKSLKFGQTNLNKLTAEQIAVATAKGWTLLA